MWAPQGVTPSLSRIKWISSLVFLPLQSLASHFISALGSVCIDWGVSYWIILRLELGEKMKVLETHVCCILLEFKWGQDDRHPIAGSLETKIYLVHFNG